MDIINKLQEDLRNKEAELAKNLKEADLSYFEILKKQSDVKIEPKCDIILETPSTPELEKLASDLGVSFEKVITNLIERYTIEHEINQRKSGQ